MSLVEISNQIRRGYLKCFDYRFQQKETKFSKDLWSRTISTNLSRRILVWLYFIFGILFKSFCARCVFRSQFLFKNSNYGPASQSRMPIPINGGVCLSPRIGVSTYSIAQRRTKLKSIADSIPHKVILWANIAASSTIDLTGLAQMQQ